MPRRLFQKVHYMAVILSALLIVGVVAPSSVFAANCAPTVPLSIGKSGASVTLLQEFLLSQGLVTSSSVTGYFGTITRAAVEQYQSARGIVAIGGLGSGLVGPRTIASMNSMCESGGGSSLTTNTSAPIQAGARLTRNLTVGSTGADVSLVQTYLKTLGFFTYTSITDYYGTMTQSAVRDYQAILHLGITGNVDAVTRQSMNNVFLTLNGSTAGVTTVTTSTATSTGASSSTSGTQTIVQGNSNGGSAGSGGGGGGGGGGGTTPVPDVTPPVISGQSATVQSANSATIIWTTDEAANSVVNYGPTTAYGLSTSTAAFITNHSMLLSGLTASSTYHYQISSTDTSGNQATTSDATFGTFSLPTITPTASAAVSPTELLVNFTTNVSASSTIAYGTSTAYGSASSTATLSTSHSFVINGLAPSTTYHYQISATDSYGDATSTGDYVLTTPATDVTAPVISNIASSTLTTATTTISWNTNEYATSQLAYGTTTAYGATTTLDNTLVLTHSVTLTNLTPAVTYHFQLFSMDASGNLGSSTDQTFFITPAPTLSFIATSSTIYSGESTELIWSTTNATSCASTGFVGTTTSGAIIVTPSGTTTYGLTCSGLGGSVSQSATVTVNPITYAAVNNSVTPSLGTELSIGHGLNANQYQAVMAVNPANANQVSVSSKTGRETADEIYNSADGGATWTATTSQASAADPDIVYDAAGNAFWSLIDNAHSSDLAFRKSTNGGVTWSAATDLPTIADHPMIFTDNSTSSPYYGTIYIAGRVTKPSTGGIILLASHDEGSTWSRATTTAATVNLGFVEGETTLPDGTIIMPITGSSSNVLTYNNAYAGEVEQGYVMKSTDGGATFSITQVANFDQPPVTGNGIPSGDSSNVVWGMHNGIPRLYLAYAQGTASGTPAYLALITSDDEGTTWSAPEAVSSSTPAGYGVAAPPNLMMNNSGVLGIQYFVVDENNYATSYIFTVDFVASNDGGASFTAPIQVPSVISTGYTFPTDVRSPEADEVYGTAMPDGSFYDVYTDSRDHGPGQYTIYGRKVTSGF